ncbi:MAG: hypothetical protein WD178_05375 [Actinomycetota bacterium]
MRFEEVQAMPMGWTLVSILPGVALVIGALAADASGEPMPLSVVAVAVGATFLLGWWFRSIKLVTEVGGDTVTLRYKGLLKTRTIPISTIRSAHARTYRPLREYGGWGIKMGRSGWAYNVSGNEGVQLKLDGARPLLIGSRKAGELAEVISSAPAFRGARTDDSGEGPTRS